MLYAGLGQTCDRVGGKAPRYETLSYALTNIGSALRMTYDADWPARTQPALALEHGYEEHVARAYTNLVDNNVEAASTPKPCTTSKRHSVLCRA